INALTIELINLDTDGLIENAQVSFDDYNNKYFIVTPVESGVKYGLKVQVGLMNEGICQGENSYRPEVVFTYILKSYEKNPNPKQYLHGGGIRIKSIKFYDKESNNVALQT